MLRFLVISLFFQKGLCLYLSLGLDKTFGIICGTYDKIQYFPVKEDYYETVCDNDCKNIVNDCSRKMNKICQLRTKNQIMYNDFCDFNQSRKYCTENIRTNHCVSCKKVKKMKTKIVPKTIRKVRLDLD